MLYPESAPALPPCEPCSGSLGFFFSTIQAFFNDICALLQDMLFKRGTEQTCLLLAPMKLKVFTLNKHTLGHIATPEKKKRKDI